MRFARCRRSGLRRALDCAARDLACNPGILHKRLCFGHDVVDERGDFLTGRLRSGRQAMQFPRNHAEPTPGFASAGRLDPGIEREQLRALGHLRDNIDLRRNRLRRRIGQVFQPHDRIGQACPDVLDIGNERGDGGIPAFSIRLRARSATAIACSASALSDSSERSIVCRSFLRRVLVQRTAGPTHQDAESKKFGSSDFTRCGIAGVPSATLPTLALKPQSKKKRRRTHGTPMRRHRGSESARFGAFPSRVSGASSEARTRCVGSRVSCDICFRTFVHRAVVPRASQLARHC